MIVVVGLCVAAILIAAYFWMGSKAPIDRTPASAASARSDHPSQKVTSTADETPSESRVADPSSNAGNSFHNLQLCAYATWELNATKALSDCSEYEGKPQFENYYAQCMNGWMNVPNRKAAAEKALTDSGCGDTSDIETRYFEATKHAARAGDPDAQMCYLQGEFGTSSGESLFTDENLEEYKRVAPGYVEAAFRRGDWRIAELLTRRSFHPGSGPVTQIDKIGEPETIYKMTKLLRLGATGTYARILDSDLDGMIHPDLVPEAALPAAVVSRGNAWAQETFIESFSGVAGLTERPTVCSPAPGHLGSLDELPRP